MCSMLLLLFFSHFLHQFHEMLIRCIHKFSFLHKILVTAPTIPVLTNNSWFIHLPNKAKKTSFSLFVHVTFPKFKMGEEVVREIAEPPSYGMTGCLLLLLLFLLILSVINIVALSTTMY